MIDLSADKTLCSFHSLPFKQTWNEPDTVIKVVTFITELFKLVVADEDFIGLCEGNSDLISANLPRPLCCWAAVNENDGLLATYTLVSVDPPSAAKIARLN